MATLYANILDPVHDTLPASVWDNPGDPEPKLKEQHKKWILTTVVAALERAGYTHVEDWLTLVFTGSLTTYQYDDTSDVDVSLFVDADHFPEWSRAEMIGVMISEVDGQTLPGTPYDMQCFVVPPEITRDDLYKPGLRAGYELATDQWLSPPERERAHDVEKEMNAEYIHALQQADKMERLLKYEPHKAEMFWHQIHRRRRADMKAGKGDYASSNIVYKFLANRGLFPKLSELTGEYIAKTGAGWDALFDQYAQPEAGFDLSRLGEEHVDHDEEGIHITCPVCAADGLHYELFEHGQGLDPSGRRHFACPNSEGPDGDGVSACGFHGYLPPGHTARLSYATDWVCNNCGFSGVNSDEKSWEEGFGKYRCPKCESRNVVESKTARNERGRFIPLDPKVQRCRIDHRAVELAARHLGIKAPVKVTLVGGSAGGYHGQNQMGEHEISVVGWLKPLAASKQTWHELAHAKQFEEGERFGVGYHDAYEQGHEAYQAHPVEVEARKWADRHPFPVALPHGHTAAAPIQVRVQQSPVAHTDGPRGARQGRAFWFDDDNNVIYLSLPGGIHTDLLNEFKIPLGQGWRGIVSPVQGVEWLGARGVFSPEETQAVADAIRPHLDTDLQHAIDQPPPQEGTWVL